MASQAPQAPPNTMQKLLTVQEAAAFLHVSTSTVYRYVSRGKIPYIRKGFGHRFRKSDLDDWLAKDKRDSFIPHKEPKNLTYMTPLYIDKHRGGEMPKGKSQTRLTFFVNGEQHVTGTVYPRNTKKRKCWCINFVGPNGDRIREIAKDAQTENDANLVLSERIKETYDREYAERKAKECIKFNDFAQCYLVRYARGNKVSWKTDEYYLKDMVGFFKDRSLRDITSEDIGLYKNFKSRHGVKKSTVNRHLSVLRKMFNLAKDWGYYPEDRKIKFEFFSERDNLKERILSEPEERRLLLVSSDHLKSILIIAINSGMRLGEILYLCWSQINFEKKLITVVKSKSGRPRSIQINSTLIDELYKLRSRNCQSVYVFLNPQTGKPFTTVARAFKAACRRANIEGLRFHDLRHTFATRLIERGADIITVKELLGHSSVRITERYTHPGLETKRKAVELLTEQARQNVHFLHETSPKTSPKGTDTPKRALFFSVN